MDAPEKAEALADGHEEPQDVTRVWLHDLMADEPMPETTAAQWETYVCCLYACLPEAVSLRYRNEVRAKHKKPALTEVPKLEREYRKQLERERAAKEANAAEH